MALKYKLVQRKNLGKDQVENPEKVYVQMISGDYVTFEELMEEVGDSTVAGSAGVKAVLDRLNVVLARHLRNGRRVSVGELGTFRLNFGSQGVVTVEEFNTGLIREPRVRFLPGKALRTMKGRTSFERILPETKEPVTGGGEEERPGEL
ncbi:MAG: DNA-binding protein [Parabacteroides sp.]|nr:DNA-binding protein [Parabacteroides sp.]